MSDWTPRTPLQRAFSRAGLHPTTCTALLLVVTSLASLSRHVHEWNELFATPGRQWFAPVVVLCVALAQWLINGHFNRAINELQTRTVLEKEEFSRTLQRTSPLTLRSELVAALMSSGAFLLLLLWTEAYEVNLWRLLPGPVAAGGLLGWFTYVGLRRTKHLALIHRSPVNGSSLASQWRDPVVRWSLFVGLYFSLIFIVAFPLLLRVKRLTIAALLLLLGCLGYILSRISSHVISSVYESRILYAFVLIVLTAGAGTAGYHFLEGWPWSDGLYMTVITMTTVGYGETRELTQGGRVFTMLLLVTSIGIAGYAISTVAAYIVEGEFTRVFRGRKMDNQIASMSDHIVVCGAGRTGAEIAQELYKTLTPFVVIDKEEEALEHLSFRREVPCLKGDATVESVLERAGIERARGLLAVLPDDQANVFLVLTVRALNPRMRIISRLNEDYNRQKLLRAGADAVVQTETIGGLRMASMMIRPSVVTFLDKMLRVTGEALRVEEVQVSDSMQGKTLGELDLNEKLGLLVVALERPGSNDYEFGPKSSTVLNKGEVLIVMGSAQQVRQARSL